MEGREKLLISIQLTICELQYSRQQSVGSILFLWTEPPVIHVGQTHWKPETLPEVKDWKGLSRKLHTKQLSLPEKIQSHFYTLPSDPFTRQVETREERSCWQLRLHTTKQHTCWSKGWLRVGMGVGGGGLGQAYQCYKNPTSICDMGM